MISVRSRSLAVLLALAPAAGLLVGSPANAATPALPTVKSATASKTSFVLGAKAGCSKITFTAVLSAVMPTAGAEYAGVAAAIFAPGKSGTDAFDAAELTRVGSTLTYRGAVDFCGKYTPGAWHAQVLGAYVPTTESGDDVAVTNVITIGVSLKRPAKLTLDASPEPVKKGKQITAAGTLKIDGSVLSKAAVAIYFQADGAKGYTLQGSATTTAAGTYSKKFTATKSGTWKAVYTGSSTRDAANATDAVKVK